VAGSHSHRILRPARVELRAAARKYEYEREGLGERFARAVDRSRSGCRRASDPLAFVGFDPSELGVRHRLVADFPFQILYRVLEGDLVEVVAIKHMKRHPGYWASRLGPASRP
jgi:plasmid stabilization system protein ParE